MTKKLTKRQRAKLIDAETRKWVEELEDEKLLALHDLTHEVMLKVDEHANIDACGRVAAPPPPLAGGTRDETGR